MLRAIDAGVLVNTTGHCIDAGVLVNTMSHWCWCIGQYDGPLMLVYWSIRWATVSQRELLLLCTAVFRGCGEALHLPGRVLEDGCFEDVANHRHVCLCSGDHCNTHDLTLLPLTYAQQYVDMKRAEDDSESNSVHWLDTPSQCGHLSSCCNYQREENTNNKGSYSNPSCCFSEKQRKKEN